MTDYLVGHELDLRALDAQFKPMKWEPVPMIRASRVTDLLQLQLQLPEHIDVRRVLKAIDACGYGPSASSRSFT